MEKREKSAEFLFEKRIGDINYNYIGSHYHNYFEIYYMKAGSCCYFIDNKIYNVETHDIIIIPNGIIHNTTYQNTNYERILLQFDKDYINPKIIVKLQKILSQHIYRPENHIKIEEKLKKIEKEYKRNDEFSDELIKCQLTELCTYILRNKSCYKSDTTTKKTNTIIQEITDYINKNFASPITLDTISKKAGFSKFYFSKFFKEYTGFGFKEYLLLVRMKEAKKLLTATDKSICDIAFLCGFNDSNYFSTIFKKLNNCSPNSYRKK